MVLKKLRGYILFVECIHSCVVQSGFRSNFRSVFGLGILIIYLVIMLNVFVQTVIILTIVCCHYGYCHYAKCNVARENGTEKQKMLVLTK